MGSRRKAFAGAVTAAALAILLASGCRAAWSPAAVPVSVDIAQWPEQEQQPELEFELEQEPEEKDDENYRLSQTAAVLFAMMCCMAVPLAYCIFKGER